MIPLPLYGGLPATLASVSRQLQGTLGKEIAKYIERLRRSSRPTAKIIHDPVWRTIRLEPFEIVLVNSPLLQRLRRIHQLGLAGYVFPGANYSRFEHSIGVLHQTQRVIEAIRRNGRSLAARTSLRRQDPISPSDEILLRVTALTHDVGHAFLSHVSERALDRLATIDGTASVRQFRQEAREFFRVPAFTQPPAVGEILSALSVLLPEWQEVLSLAQVPHWPDAAALSFEMARLICGGRDPKRPFLSEIISGPLDVDKLDYIPRDCYMAGVPMPVDVDRLLEKIQVVTVPASGLPASEYQDEAAVAADETVQVLAVQTAGSRAFEELVISRFLLFEKLYYHQKIRAMEGAVVNALEILMAETEEFREVATYFRMTDEEFLLQHWPTQSSTTSRLEAARELVAGIVDRNPMIRCYAFGPGLSKNVEPDSIAFRTAWKKLEPMVSAKRGKAYISFRSRVAEKARMLLQWAGQPAVADALLEQHIVIDLPPVQGLAQKTKFFVGDDQFGVEQFISRFRVEKWAEAYETQHTIGYVYTMPEFAVAVYFAVRDLIWSEVQLSFDDWSWTRTKLKSTDLQAFSRMIAGKDGGHFTFSEPEFIVQRRAFGQRNDQKLGVINQYGDVLADVVERCKTFESHEGTRLSAQSVRTWLLQFDVEEIPSVIRVLCAIKYWGRSALADALAFSVIGRFPEGLYALGLGAPTSSSHHLTYLWDDLRGKLRDKASVVSTATEIKSDLPIVIYDDNVGSGGQAGTIFSQWFGITNRDFDLDEKHSEPLTAPEVERLRHVPIFLVFATGFRSGLAKIVARLRELTDNQQISGLIIDPADVGCFRPAARVFNEPAEAEKARRAFIRAGELALHETVIERGWSLEKTSDRILGYGNACGLTVFQYNVPTTTLTALWSTSRSIPSSWAALFPRRPRNS